MKFVDKSHMISSHQRFFNFKNLRKLTRKRSRRIGKWLVWQFCLTLWMKEWRCTVGFFSIQIHWEVMSNFEFCDEPRKLRLLITSKWIWMGKNPTVHLHYFIHRVRQNCACQTNHFTFLREMALLCGWHQIIGISREVEFSGCPGTRQCLGLRVTGIRVKVERRLVLFRSCAVQREVFLVWQFSGKFFLRSSEREAKLQAVGQFYNLVLGFFISFWFWVQVSDQVAI